MVSDVRSQTSRRDITSLSSQECMQEREPRENEVFVCPP